MIKKLIRLFLILVAILMLPSASGALAKDAQVTALRWTSRNDGNPPFVRIAMDLSKAVHAEAAIDDAGKNFEVVLKKTSMGSVASQYDMDPRAIDFATLSEKDGDTYLDVALSKPQKIDDIRVFALRPDAKMKKPHRLVVDIPVIGAKQTYTKKASSAASSSPASSYKKQSYNVSSDAKSVLKGKIICIDPGHGGTDVGAIGHIGGKDVYEKNITLSIALPLRDMLTSAVARGYDCLKMKVGVNPELDVARLSAVRNAVGKDIVIRIDANQAWTPKQAVKILNKMQELGLDIELVEQPVSAHDFAGLKYVTDRSYVPVLADEAVFSPENAMTILQMGAADLINIKLMKCGGIYNALKIASAAEVFGVECMIGCMLEAKISVNAAVHLACAKNIITKVDLDGPVLCSEDPILGGAAFDEKIITVADAPGLGIQGIDPKYLTYID